MSKPTELRLTWADIETVVHQTPRRRVKGPTGEWQAFDVSDAAIEAAVHVCRLLGVRLVLEGDDSEVTYEPPERAA